MQVLFNKIQYYRERISSDLDGFYKSLDEKGIRYAFVAKYGFMNMPIIVDADLQSDALTSLKHAAYGATTAPVTKTLSEDYLASVSEDNHRYITPDKQVDLSTCVAPDRTWILKNAHHDVFDCTIPVIYAFLNGTNETVGTVYKKTGMSQFLVYDYSTDTASNMTEDNCADYEWLTAPVEEPDKESIFVAAMRWFTMLFKIIGMLLRGEISFGEAKEIL